MLKLKDNNGTIVNEKELVMVSFTSRGEYMFLDLTRKYKYKYKQAFKSEKVIHINQQVVISSNPRRS